MAKDTRSHFIDPHRDFVVKTTRRLLSALAMALLVMPAAARSQPAAVSRLAGPPGGAGALDGVAGVASFSGPTAVAVGSDGAVYIADFYNNSIRRLSADRTTVTTFAGRSGAAGARDGQGTAAGFRGPEGLAFDGAGVLYVTDRYNCTIRAVTPSGIVSTLAGRAFECGSQDGSGSSARFNQPTGLTFDAAQNVLYVSDTVNHTIRRVTLTGNVTTVAGLAGAVGSADGTGSSARFSSPAGLAALDGRVYIADRNNHTIRMLTVSTGEVSTFAGVAGFAGVSDGTGSGARLSYPLGLVAGTDLFVTDNYLVRRVTTGGVVTTIAGAAGISDSIDGAPGAGRFVFPHGLGIESNGGVIVGDTLAASVRRVDAAGAVTTLTGRTAPRGSRDGPSTAARFNEPRDVASDSSGNVYVADGANCTVRRVTPAGTVTTVAGAAGTCATIDGPLASARFGRLDGIAVDAANTIFVADNDRIRRIVGGNVENLAGSFPGDVDGTGTNASFNWPRSIAVDPAGNVIVADTFNHKIRRVTPLGVTTTLAGNGTPGAQDGTGTAARFNMPWAVTVDATGNVYVSDYSNQRVRRVSPAGVVTTVASGLFYLEDLVATPDGSVLLLQGDKLSRLLPSGQIVHVAGPMDPMANGPYGSSDGVGYAARFYEALGITYVPSGRTYIADRYNHAIREVGPAYAVSAVTATGSREASLSGDGRFLAYTSNASSIVSGDTNGVADVFVLDRAANQHRRVSVSSVSGESNGASRTPRISESGRFVAFVSSASNLVLGDTNAVDDVFLHDRDADRDGVFDEPGAIQTTRVSVATGNIQANGASTMPDLSAEGGAVVFASMASNLVGGDGNGVADIFLHTVATGETRRVSVSSLGVPANGPSRAPTVSRLGRRVAFASDATNLIALDANGVRDIFLHDLSTLATTRVSGFSAATAPLTGGVVAALSGELDGTSDDPSISGTGRRVVYSSDATNAVPGDTNGRSDIFNWDEDTDQTTRESEPATGGQSNGDSTLPEISDDGKAVSYPSNADNLDPGDTNGRSDVFLTFIDVPGSTQRVSTDAENLASSPSATLDGTGATVGFVATGAGAPDTAVFLRSSPVLITGVTPPAAPPGQVTRVTITGVGFSDRARVSVGGRDVTVISATSTTLVVDVPIGVAADLTDVTVVTPDGVASSPHAMARVEIPADTDTDGDGLPDAWETRYGLSRDLTTGDDGAAGDPDGDGMSNAAELAAHSHPRGTNRRFLAEGVSNAFFTTRLAVFNPAEVPIEVVLHVQPDSGAPIAHPVTVAPRERLTIAPETLDGVADKSYATAIESDLPVVVDRTVSWTATGYGSHAETAVAAPSRTWYLAEGSTTGAFQLFYLLQNPQTFPVTTTVTYLRPAGFGPIVRQYRLNPVSRLTIYVNELGPELDETDLSAVITADAPIIAERAMYMNRPEQVYAAGHESAGVTAPATTWFLAEGATGTFFDLFVLLANPTTTAANVRVTYLLPNGTTYIKAYVVAAQSRRTIYVDDETIDGERPLTDTPVSTTVESVNGVPILVERAMWWPQTGGWTEAHNSPGTTVVGTLWALAEGENGGTQAAQTFVLVANTASHVGRVRLSVFTDDGHAYTHEVDVPALSRTTVDISNRLFPGVAGHRFGTLVESLGDAPAPIVVERAVYTSPGGIIWAAGTNAVATRLR